MYLDQRGLAYYRVHADWLVQTLQRNRGDPTGWDPWTVVGSGANEA